MVLAYAVKDGRLAVNLAQGVSPPRINEAEKRFLTHRQVPQLAENCGPEYRLVVLFLAYTGLRWGEMAALRVGRVDFLRRRVLMAESVTPVEGRDDVRAEPRDMSGARCRCRGSWSTRSRSGGGVPPRRLVFPGGRGAVLRSQTFQRAALTEAAAGFGMPGFHPHELRHTAA